MPRAGRSESGLTPSRRESSPSSRLMRRRGSTTSCGLHQRQEGRRLIRCMSFLASARSVPVPVAFPRLRLGEAKAQTLQMASDRRGSKRRGRRACLKVEATGGRNTTTLVAPLVLCIIRRLTAPAPAVTSRHLLGLGEHPRRHALVSVGQAGGGSSSTRYLCSWRRTDGGIATLETRACQRDNLQSSERFCCPDGALPNLKPKRLQDRVRLGIYY